MKQETANLRDRFAKEFVDGGLSNVKFFVRPDNRPSFDEFVHEVNRIEDTIMAGETKQVLPKDIDSGAEQVRFDAPFS